MIASPFLACGAAIGQDSKYENLTIEEALQFCAAFTDGSERLACFEALAKSAEGKKAARAPMAETESPIDEPDISQNIADAPPSTTGNALAAPAGIKKPVPEDAGSSASETRFTFMRSNDAEQKRKKREKYELAVYRAWRNPLGELRIAFTNGEIWAQTGDGTRYTPETGETVVFKPGLFGGWTLSMDGGRFGIRARQVNG
jgi:hypothetical protein